METAILAIKGYYDCLSAQLMAKIAAKYPTNTYADAASGRKRRKKIQRTF